MPQLTFHGAAETVTGSKYLLEADKARVLIDCGLFQGLKELRLKNWQPLPFTAASVQAVVLTHAHIDHVGYLPRFVRDGFRGPVYCTPATAELAEIILFDCAKNQAGRRRLRQRTRASRSTSRRCRCYDADDVTRALKLLRPTPRDDGSRPPSRSGPAITTAGICSGRSMIEVEIRTDRSRCESCSPATSAAIMRRCITIRPRRRRATI